MWCFLQYATPLHIELHLICSVVCCTLPCHASLNRRCIILVVHHAMIMWWLFTIVFDSFRVTSRVIFGFRSRVVRIHSSTSICLLRELVLLPCGISGKMAIPSKSLLSLLASCSLYCYAYAATPTTCYIMPPILPCQASNPPCPSKPLFGYVTALLTPLIALLVAGEDWSLFLVGIRLLLGYHNISYLY